MRLRECVVTLNGQSCIETTNLMLVFWPYIAGRWFEMIVRDIVDKWDDIPSVEPLCIDFT